MTPYLLGKEKFSYYSDRLKEVCTIFKIKIALNECGLTTLNDRDDFTEGWYDAKDEFLAYKFKNQIKSLSKFIRKHNLELKCSVCDYEDIDIIIDGYNLQPLHRFL